MPIVSYTKDWSDVPTCTTHILRALAETDPVLWIGSIGTRKPKLHSGRDLARILARLREGGGRLESVAPNIDVLHPRLFPAARGALARLLNRAILARHIGSWRKPRSGSIEQWLFVPNAVDYLDAVESGLVVYYCVDDWTRFEHLDSEWMADCERRLLERADVVFAVSSFLEEKCREVAGEKVHRIGHGVWHELFSESLALRKESTVKPVLGFYGNLSEWVDYPLIEALATSRADWTSRA